MCLRPTYLKMLDFRDDAVQKWSQLIRRKPVGSVPDGRQAQSPRVGSRERIIHICLPHWKH